MKNIWMRSEMHCSTCTSLRVVGGSKRCIQLQIISKMAEKSERKVEIDHEITNINRLPKMYALGTRHRKMYTKLYNNSNFINSFHSFGNSFESHHLQQWAWLGPIRLTSVPLQPTSIAIVIYWLHWNVLQ